MYFTNYDYNLKEGRKYSEVYTFNKRWDQSSTDNPQRVTGINRENFWISKYGEDFLKYRAVEYHDQLFRRPNQLRSGGIALPDRNSSPMEYTNGSHPRRYYLGNRYVAICGHCTKSVGLKDGKVIFYDSNATAITYDIENFDPNIPSTGEGMQSGLQPAYIRNPLTDTTAFGDIVMVRLTTDPADDGIPEIKQCAGPLVQSKKTNKLYMTGLGVLFPVFNTSKSFGGRLGGRDIITWSGDSGTILFHDTFDGWLPSNQFSGDFPIPINLLREITGDDDYQVLDSSSKSYYLMETFPEDNFGVTFDSFSVVSQEGVFAEVTAKNIEGKTKKLTPVLGMTSSVFDGNFYNDDKVGFIIDTRPPAGLTQTIPFPFSEEVANRPIRFFVQPQSIKEDNDSESGLPITTNVKFKMSDGTVIGGNEEIAVAPTLFLDSNYDFSPFAGETFDMIIQASTDLGSDTYTTELNSIGFTGTTGSGLFYDNTNFIIDAGLTVGTAFDQNLPIEYRWTVYVQTLPSEILSIRALGGSTFDISSVSNRAGDTLVVGLNVLSPFYTENFPDPDVGVHYSKTFII